MRWEKTLGNRLHILRRNRSLRLQDVSDQVHVNITDLSRIERGQRPNVRFSVILKLARYYGVGLDELCGETEIPSLNEHL